MFALGACVSMFVLAIAIGASPLPEPARSDFAVWALSPWLGISYGIQRAIDLLGPPGLSEPASMYLSWEAVALILAVSLILLFGTLRTLALCYLAWRRRSAVNE